MTFVVGLMRKTNNSKDRSRSLRDDKQKDNGKDNDKNNDKDNGKGNGKNNDKDNGSGCRSVTATSKSTRRGPGWTATWMGHPSFCD